MIDGNALPPQMTGQVMPPQEIPGANPTEGIPTPTPEGAEGGLDLNSLLGGAK